jgi:L-alanine-DL-glutamate epimerase-like enolase superfamily enzyme
MPKIIHIRPVLLSAPYADTETNLEVLHHLTSGYRTCGLVEITLDDGTVGLGEGYLAVFAPRVFESLIHLLAPILIGCDIDNHKQIYNELLLTTGYWSLQGAAQHAISAVEIALWDCKAQLANIPVYRLLGYEGDAPRLKLYASGGDSCIPDAMSVEFEAIKQLGIDTFKIRARKEDVNKAIWCLKQGVENGTKIAIDMTQNLAIPSQSIGDVLRFVDDIGFTEYIAFIEEAFGPDSIEDFPHLRGEITIPVAGGEIVTTFRELQGRIEADYYDIAQPDATVIGGIQPTIDLFKVAQASNTEIYVHCWGGPVGMMANYHAAIAGGGQVAEWPMPQFELRNALVKDKWNIQDGYLYLPDSPGLNTHLTQAIEDEFAFREDAVYDCLVRDSKKLSDTIWE